MLIIIILNIIRIRLLLVEVGRKKIWQATVMIALILSFSASCMNSTLVGFQL
jgi:hypothetical protein